MGALGRVLGRWGYIIGIGSHGRIIVTAEAPEIIKGSARQKKRTFEEAPRE